MIEPSMFFALGFLAAGLIALIIFPLVHARAVRLTRRRIEAATPHSIAEIQADKDQLRAEFAVSTRRLEVSVEQLKGKTSSQLADLGKKTAAISALKTELAEKAATIAALETRGSALHDELRATQEQLATRTAAHGDAERRIAEKDAEYGKLRMDFEEKSVTADSQRIEIVALKTQGGTLKDQIDTLQQQIRQTEEYLGRERTTSEQTGRELEQQRSVLGALSERSQTLERDLGAQSTEAEALRRRTAEVEPQLLEQEMRLRELTRERNQLAAEVAAFRRQAGTSWESERQENAMLRERINDVAAEVARLTAALEGPDSPIDSILAEEAAATAAAARKETAIPFPKTGVTLADRIRALQARTPRHGSAR